MNRMKEIQIGEEVAGGATNDRMHINNTETEKNCLEWYEKYLRAYNYWSSLDSSQKEDKTKDALSDNSQTTALAISSGSAMRPIGCINVKVSRS